MPNKDVSALTEEYLRRRIGELKGHISGLWSLATKVTHEIATALVYAPTDSRDAGMVRELYHELFLELGSTQSVYLKAIQAFFAEIGVTVRLDNESGEVIAKINKAKWKQMEGEPAEAMLAKLESKRLKAFLPEPKRKGSAGKGGSKHGPATKDKFETCLKDCYDKAAKIRSEVGDEAPVMDTIYKEIESLHARINAFYEQLTTAAKERMTADLAKLAYAKELPPVSTVTNEEQKGEHRDAA